VLHEIHSSVHNLFHNRSDWKKMKKIAFLNEEIGNVLSNTNSIEIMRNVQSREPFTSLISEGTLHKRKNAHQWTRKTETVYICLYLFI
jgi:hypothetical protein